MASAKTKTIDGKKYLQWGNPAVGRSVYYEAGPVAVQLQRLEQNVNRCFHHRTLYNYLKKLKDTTSMFVSEVHSQRSDRAYCRMMVPGSQVDYFLMHGAAFITRLVLQDTDYQNDLEKMRAPGAYRVERNENGRWEPKKAETKISTVHASINGEVEELDEVIQFMPTMIAKAHGGDHEITGKGKQRGFTHLYMPGKNSKKYGWREMVASVPVSGTKAHAAARQSLVARTAACIEIAAAAKDPVKWTVQGSGSAIFCDAVAKVIQDNPDLSLARQHAHFFNPHTDPIRIKAIIGGAGAQEGYSSAFKSPGNLKAMAQGHRQYSNDKIAAAKLEKPGASQLAGRQDANKLDSLANDVKVMGVTISSLVAGTIGLIQHPDLVQSAANAYVTGLQSAPVSTIAGSMVAAAGVHTLVTATAPKMLALGHLGLAAIQGDRRLDQLTESDTFKAYDQFKTLKLGYSI